MTITNNHRLIYAITVYLSGFQRGRYRPLLVGGEEMLSGDELVLGGKVVVNISLKEVIWAFASQALNLT